ncbi:MAG: hypothetical protein AUI61_02535 [Thaumarchaeota archaeon 13_1_40CM_2_39_13_2]|nr:MAG: hypothetical protein AUI61_02535 [Thaumarchaeota archaeon 13_1_40CM_2_39_13_2]OLE40936.1 MAG: hypothetical protein AUG16_01995 [Thaumarchaeota archaeon 13_1_20CM_2_39_20]
MSTKVVSTKLNEDEYTKLMDACNIEGVSVSFLVKDAIMMKVDPNYLMNRIVEKMDVNPEFLSQVRNKIKEKTRKTLEAKEYTVDDLRIALGLKPVEKK